MSRSRLLASFALLTVLGCGGAQHAAPVETTAHAGSPAQRFDALASEYFQARYRFNPTEATSAGVHDYDSALDDFSPEALRRYTDWLAREHAQLDRLIPGLPAESTPAGPRGSDHPRLDATILRDAIQLELLRLTEWHELATHPSAFHQIAADTVYQLMVRDFAPLDVRVRNATARLHAVPQMLRVGQHWLANPPRLAVEVALREISGSIEMLRDVFPTFAARSSVPADRDAARAASVEATAALVTYREALQSLLPHATGDYHDGRERWITRARLGDGVDETPDAIRAGALAEVRRLQADMRTIAQRIAQPNEDMPATLARLRHQHPPAAGLLDAYRAQQSEVRDFVRAHGLATIDPARDNLTIQETPGFLRATLFAALSSPGPLEQVDRRTLFYVTPADLTRSADEIDAYLTEHSNGSIAITTVHEAYPGHHVQGIHQRTAHSLVRQILWQGSYGEGWAHYCEQMMVDEGFGNDEIRLDQRQEALLRAARAYLDVGVHVFGLGYDDAVRFYRDEAFMSQPGAEMEARRVCLNPASVFVYTYGKLAIMRLRHAVVDAAGPGHPTLGEFHNALIDFGSAPLPAVAEALFHTHLGPWESPSSRSPAP